VLSVRRGPQRLEQGLRGFFEKRVLRFAPHKLGGAVETGRRREIGVDRPAAAKPAELVPGHLCHGAREPPGVGRMPPRNQPGREMVAADFEVESALFG
jgi:hypothetical protein